MNFLDWIKKHIAIFTFLLSLIFSVLGFVGGVIVSYYKVQSKFEVIDNSFDKVNFKLDLIKKQMTDETENTQAVFRTHRSHINKLEEEIK
jgi:hypothetical protein